MTKSPFFRCVSLFLFFISPFLLKSQNVGINTTTPDASAALDITSTTSGVLVPRMTTTQRTAISTPATGLLVFDTTLGQFYFYSGSSWSAVPLSTSSAISYVGTSYLGKTSGVGSTGTSEGTSSNLYNIGIGASVLNANSTGNNNIGLGQNANNGNTTGTDNIAIGQNALNTNNQLKYNIAIGKDALSGLTYNSSYSTTDGAIAIGYQAGQYQTSALGVTAVGYQSQQNGTGNYSTSFGYQALKNITGSQQTAVGYQALLNASSPYNTAVGYQAGLTITGSNATGNYGKNTFLGSLADASSSSLYNATAIGYNAKVATSNSMVLGGTGTDAVNVGIGTTSPTEKLEVSGKTKTTNLQMTSGATSGYFMKSDASGNASWTSNIYDNGSNIGIGTTSPTQAKLVVNGSVSNSLSSYGYLNSSGVVGTSSTANTYTIYASSHIAAGGFHAFSDRRIKKILRGSNSAEDLATLMQIKITDYQLIDSISKGNRIIKKVIAQELAEVLPNAVNTMTDFIPNIYKLAKIENGFVALSNHGLIVGDKVKLIFGNKQDVYKVLKINEKGFKIDCGRYAWPCVSTSSSSSSGVFVYGKEINDFHTVDYEALSTLNISATQELVKQLNDLKVQNTVLKLKTEKAELDNQNMKADIEVLKATVFKKAN